MYLLAFFKEIAKFLRRRYRPEQHYMRGPGPKWHERHRRSASLRSWTGTIFAVITEARPAPWTGIV